MSVKFSFTLSDEEAELLFSVLGDEADVAADIASNAKERSDAERRWFKKYSDGLRALKNKMTNVREANMTTKKTIEFSCSTPTYPRVAVDADAPGNQPCESPGCGKLRRECAHFFHGDYR